MNHVFVFCFYRMPVFTSTDNRNLHWRVDCLSSNHWGDKEENSNLSKRKILKTLKKKMVLCYIRSTAILASNIIVADLQQPNVNSDKRFTFMNFKYTPLCAASIRDRRLSTRLFTLKKDLLFRWGSDVTKSWLVATSEHEGSSSYAHKKWHTSVRQIFSTHTLLETTNTFYHLALATTTTMSELAFDVIVVLTVRPHKL